MEEHDTNSKNELLDIYDEKGQLSGKTGSRDEIHSKGFWFDLPTESIFYLTNFQRHKVIHVWIVNKEGKEFRGFLE